MLRPTVFHRSNSGKFLLWTAPLPLESCLLYECFEVNLLQEESRDHRALIWMNSPIEKLGYTVAVWPYVSPLLVSVSQTLVVAW